MYSVQSKGHQENTPLHIYRTEIPHIVIEALDLDVYERSLYLVLKKTAGDAGVCFKSNATLCKEAACSLSKLKQMKKSLSMPREALNGRPLISIEKRHSRYGDFDTDLIKIVDIWDLNIIFMEGKNFEGKEIDIGRSHETPPINPEMKLPLSENILKQGGRVLQTHKEEPLNNIINKSNKANTHAREEIPNSAPAFAPLLYSKQKKEGRSFSKRENEEAFSKLSDEEKEFCLEATNFDPLTCEKLTIKFISDTIQNHSFTKLKNAYLIAVDKIKKGASVRNFAGYVIGFIKKDIIYDLDLFDFQLKVSEKASKTSKFIEVHKQFVSWPTIGKDITFGRLSNEEFMKKANENTKLAEEHERKKA